MDPITIVLSLMVKIFFALMRLLAFIFKNGFGWLFIGYFVYYEVFDNPTALQHVICMVIAWGGTFFHFFGRAAIRKIIDRRK